MAKTYQQLQKKIDQLQQRAEAARKKEIAGVIKEIKEIKGVITAWGLTAQDLGLATGTHTGASKPGATGVGAKRTRRATKSVARAAAYSDETGNTWGGRGPRPKWLRAALEAGRSLEDFKA